MEELVSAPIIRQIFKLGLSARIIADQKSIFPIIINGKMGTVSANQYQIQMKTGKDNISRYKQFMIELKGNIDIESLRYGGKVTIEHLRGESDYYKMRVINLYKLNERQFRRVPYRRAIQVVAPIKHEAILVNISASGALIECDKPINSETFKVAFTLAKRNLLLNCVTVEEFHDDKEKNYKVRCYFDPIDRNTQKIIKEVVNQITYMAKERLRGTKEQ